MKRFLIAIPFAFVVCCSSSRQTKTVQNSELLWSSPVGIPYKTENSNNPHIYKNGYGSITIVADVLELDTMEIPVNKVKFNSVMAANYTQAAMFQEYGSWTRSLCTDISRSNGIKKSHVILIWDNVQLLPQSTKRYHVFCEGDETIKEIYTSALVFDEHYNDALQADNPERNLIIKALGEKIQHLKSSRSFHMMVEKLRAQEKSN